MGRRIAGAALCVALVGSIAVLVPAAPAAAIAFNVNSTDDQFDFSNGEITLREVFQASSSDVGESHIHLAQGETYVLDRCAGAGSGAVTGGDTSDLHIHGVGSTIVQTCENEAVINHTGTGKLWLHDVTVVGGERTSGSGPAGGVSSVGPIEIYNSIITDNSTNDPAGAGAVHSDGDIVVLRSVIENSSAPDGGGALRAGGKITVEQSAVVGNHSGTGAAISSAGAIEVINSTVAGNQADDGAPSGIESTGSGTVRLISATVAQNDGPQIGRTSAAVVELRASAIVVPLSGPNCAFTPAATSLGFNYSTDGTCNPNGSSDVGNGAEPQFRFLFRLGGVVPGLYPLPGSPLLDKIPTPLLPRNVDQRNVSRPQQGAGDIGAIEVVRCTSFSDVSPSAPFCQEVGWLAGSGITTGYPNGTFRPGDNVTRASMAAFLNRYDGARWGTEAACPSNGAFPDVRNSHPFCTDVLWLVREGITTGYPNGRFKPDDVVTRGSMAAFMYRLEGSPQGPNPTCSSAPFPDVAVTNPFCGHIAWLANTGVTAGKPDGTYGPDDPVNRGSMAAFLYRLGDGVN